MIEIRGLAKSYGDHQALCDVSLSIRPGEFVVVLGPSGAGKSTLLRCINRLIEPTAGDIVVDGTSLSSNRRDLRLLRRNVAMIFQQHNLVKRLCVLKNVLVGRMADLSPILSSAAALPRGRREDRAALPRAGRDDATRPRSRADALSGGEQQRVGIARALAQQPKFMLADEPVASLDPKTSRIVLTYLKKSCKESNIAVLCNLHQIDYALEFAERVVGLSAGRVVYDGPPAGVSGDVIRSIYPGLDDPNVLDAAQRLTERRRAAAEADRRRSPLSKRGPETMSLQFVVNKPRGPLGWWIMVPILRRHASPSSGGRPSAPSSASPASSTGLPWIGDFLGRMLPPNFAFMQKLVQPAIETVQIALWGTLLGIVLALPVCFFAARNLSPMPAVFHSLRQVLNVMRGINEIILALIFVAAVGLGPFAGVLAIALHGAGMLGKFFAEAIEEIDEGPLDALRAAGAGTLADASCSACCRRSCRPGSASCSTASRPTSASRPCSAWSARAASASS